MMGDGDFFDDQAKVMHKNWHKAVNAIESRKQVDNSSLEDAEIAAGIGKVHAKH